MAGNPLPVRPSNIERPPILQVFVAELASVGIASIPVNRPSQSTCV